MGALPSRDTSYHSAPPTADFSYHQAKREAAQYRIKQTVAELQAQAQLPTTATARARAIAEHGKISQQTLYKASNLSLWHPEHQVPTKPAEQAETQAEQEITPIAQNKRKIIQIKLLQPLSNKRITQIHIHEGFVIQNLILSASEALALQGQRALPIQELPEQGGSGGESTTPTIQGWDDLRKSLPESMQAKIATAERSRQRKDELEQKRRERAQARRQQLQLDLESRPRTPDELAAIEHEVSQIFERQGLRREVDLSQPARQDEIRTAPPQDALKDLPLFRLTEQLSQTGKVQANFEAGDLGQVAECWLEGDE
jgi:hypothetical protein